MKLHIAKFEPERIGGGWSFTRNLVAGLADLRKVQVTGYEEADIYFIPSPSMVSREEVLKAKDDGKKIVLRIDNAVRNSRNRNTGMTRMKDFANWADAVIYQSQWARSYLKEYLGKDGVVILNGVDTDLFRPFDVKNDTNNILYSRFNRDETKNFEVARYWFSRYYHQHPESRLYIVGQFSQEIRDGNFDFYNGEDFEYLGVLTPKHLAKIYRNCSKFLYTYFNDACSNSLIEALVSGCELVGDKYYRQTGGAKEIIHMHQKHGREFFSLNRMAEDYVKVMELL